MVTPRIQRLLVLLGCGVLLIGLANTAMAQSMGSPVVLFDGNSLEGWAQANGSAHSGWVVQDGALFRQAGGGDLYHQGSWRDFVLYFQWKVSHGGNSGLKYRVRKYGNAWLGCEYQILDDQNASERNKAASLYDLYQPVSHKPIVQPDQWHQGKIVVCGNRLEHWLDGVLVVQAQVGSDAWIDRVAESKFRDRERFGANREGRIFLQDHGNPVWFRQIVLVPLYCDQPPQVGNPAVFPPGGLATACDGWAGTRPCDSNRACLTPAVPADCRFHGRPRFRGQGCPPQRTLFLRRRWPK